MLLILNTCDRAKIVRAGRGRIGNADEHARLQNRHRKIYVLPTGRVAAPGYSRTTYRGERAVKRVRQHIVRHLWTPPTAKNRLRKCGWPVARRCRSLWKRHSQDIAEAIGRSRTGPSILNQANRISGP